MNREQRIKKLASAIQREIVSCPNEQSSVGDGEIFWISGSSTPVSDLLMNHDVPEDLEEEVVSRLHCPACGSALEAWQDVGTKFSFEQDHESTIEAAMHKYGKRLFDFSAFLHKCQMLGAAHSFGKTILRELRKAPRMVLQKQHWFRARTNREHGFGPAPRDKVADQRYNSSGKPQWYFADGPQTAVAEVSDIGKAWVQKFEIDHLDGLLDLRSWQAEDDRALDEEGNYRPPHDALVVSLIYGDLLTQTQYDALEDRQWKPEYVVPRFVAEAAMETGFSGILCNSVRFEGENLVVFNHEWNPKPLGDPFMVELDETALKLRKRFFWNQGQASYF